MACSSVSEGPPLPFGTVTLQIAGSAPAQLAAFRDGVDAPWQSATMTGPGTYTAVVHGPYVVTVVCVSAPLGAGGVILTNVQQTAATPEDPQMIAGCEDGTADSTDHLVTGQVLQPGAIELGGVPLSSTAPSWSFILPVPTGSFDLFVSSADRMFIQRGLSVSGDMMLPAIDLASTGVALVPTAFTATNAAPGETLEVQVGVVNPTTENYPARLYLGPLATAKVAAASALVSSDVQTVSVRGSTATTLRALRHTFTTGGTDTAYTLPPPLDVQWAVQAGDLSLSWTSLPAADDMDLSASAGRLTSDLDTSGHFLAATGATQLTIDTDIPGFQPAWRIDFTSQFNRQLYVQNGTETTQLTTNEIDETVNAPSGSARSAPSSRAHGHGAARSAIQP